MRHHSPCRRFPNRCASRGITSGGRMIPAREPRTPRDAARLLVLDSEGGTFEDTLMPELPRFLRPGDLLVVNEAATLPASLRARTASGVEAEIRLLGQIENSTWKAAVFGPGDWRTPTELRDPPERVTPGSVLSVGESLAMEVVEVSPDSPRLITVRFDRSESGDTSTTSIARLSPTLRTDPGVRSESASPLVQKQQLSMWSLQSDQGGESRLPHRTPSVPAAMRGAWQHR